MLNIHLKAARGWRSSVLAAVMPSKGDGAGTDTFRPHRAYGQLRNTESFQKISETSIHYVIAASEIFCLSSVFFIAFCRIRTFTTASHLPLVSAVHGSRQ